MFGIPPTKLSIDGTKEDLSGNLNNGQYNVPVFDCKFIVGPKAETVMINRAVFTLESAEFERILNDNCASEFRLIDDDPNVFRNLRYIIYNKNISTMEQYSFADILKIYKLSEEYKVFSVVKLCRDHVKNLVKTSSIPNVILAYYFGLEFKYNDIIECAVNFFISQNGANQLELFNKIASTFEVEAHAISSNKKTKDELLKLCLNHVDFRNMTRDDFINGPGTSNILSGDQKYSILSKKSKETNCRNCPKTYNPSGPIKLNNL